MTTILIVKPFDKSVKEQEEAIDALDFTKMKTKIEKECEFSKKRLDDAERDYKNFLKMRARFPKMVLIPGNDVDALWHVHILDLKRYLNDCYAIFGEIIFHQPFYSLDESSQGEIDTLRETTSKLWKKEFGYELVHDSDSDCCD